jgi:hypothetical protein
MHECSGIESSGIESSGMESTRMERRMERRMEHHRSALTGLEHARRNNMTSNIMKDRSQQKTKNESHARTASLVNMHTIKSVSLIPSSAIFWSSLSTLPVKMSFCLSVAKSALLVAMAVFTFAICQGDQAR